jgi:hypothetical protein
MQQKTQHPVQFEITEQMTAIGLDPTMYGTHTPRRTKASLIYRRTKNLRAVQLLLGHTKLEAPSDTWESRSMMLWNGGTNGSLTIHSEGRCLTVAIRPMAAVRQTLFFRAESDIGYDKWQNRYFVRVFLLAMYNMAGPRTKTLILYVREV